jgi:hypothetical protein
MTRLVPGIWTSKSIPRPTQSYRACGNFESGELFDRQARVHRYPPIFASAIVPDYLTPELVRIIEFLNEQMNPAEVLGVEEKPFQGKGVRTPVPRVVGLSESAKQKRSVSTVGFQWDD